MNKAQGSLEYLIIVAAVLSIAAVVVAFISGTFGSQRQQASIAACKDAAGKCSTKLATTNSPDCGFCDTVCNGTGSGNVDLCKSGSVTDISGS